jgi:hypothetical protein
VGRGVQVRVVRYQSIAFKGDPMSHAVRAAGREETGRLIAEIVGLRSYVLYSEAETKKEE